MELFSAEAESIRKMVGEWLSRPDDYYEVEATFHGGEVDATTFMNIAQRLRAKGYTALPQDDHLTITTPEHVRFTVNSYAIIQQYCSDNTLAGKPYTVVIKDRTAVDSQLDLDDYKTRIKIRRETPVPEAKVKDIFMSWPQQRKAFRMIRRWSFEGDGIRYDLSIVRSTRRDARGEYRWQRKFDDQDVLASKPRYEIEVELLHKEGDTAEVAMKRLVKGVGEVLRGIQKNTLLIRESQKQKVLGAYKELTGSTLFRGPSMKTLLKVNFSKERTKNRPNIRDGYNVTDKADGLRCLGFVDGKGDLYLIDMAMNVYRTGLRQPELRLSLVDGEWVTKTIDRPPKPMNQFLIFDIFYATDKRDVSQFPFEPGAVPAALARTSGPAGEEGPAAAPAPPKPEDSRYNLIKLWTSIWNKPEGGAKPVAQGITATTRLEIATKEFFFGKPGSDGIFALASRIWSASKPYYTDGLIFTPNALPLPKQPASKFPEQFKWKPPQDNTIDFLVVTEKEKETKQDKIITAVKPVTGETVTYKTLRLYVGSRTENPRDLVLNKKKLPQTDQTFKGKKGDDYKPVLFRPQDYPDPYASVCNLPIQTDPDSGETYVATEGGDPIQDKTIVEMRYDPAAPPGWRWIPLRVRMDKTEQYQRGVLSKTLNAQIVAEDVWNTIYDPITESMICTGAEEPTQTEIDAYGEGMAIRTAAAKRYFDRKAPALDPALTRPLVKFHNRWIKEKILYPTGLQAWKKDVSSRTLLDLACGQGNDLHMWRRVGVDFVLGVDYASQNILDPVDGAYARYMKLAADEGMDRIEPMVFVIGDVSKSLISGTAGATEEEKDILRSVLGRQKPIGPVPSFISEEAASRLKAKADCVSCMFAVHYFFESPEKINGFLRNIAENLKIGGYFIGCCFDGDRVFDALREKAKGESISGQEKGAMLWKITKQYEAEELVEESKGFGVGIDVEFATIGMAHREYLVPFTVLEERMRMVGCELLSKEELAEVGLKNSTATFDVSWEMAKQRGQEFAMVDAAKEFSFFNRWFIFKRKREAIIAEAMMEGARAMAEATGVPGSAVEPIATTVAPTAKINARPSVGRVANLRKNAAANSAAATALQREMGERVANAIEGMDETLGAAPAAAPPARTIPVEPGSAAAPAALKTYQPGEIFLFYTDAAVRDTLRIKDNGSGRWLAPSAPFPIVDPEDESAVYPTVEHFLAGMRVKKATNKPELAKTIFSREGTIHQRFLQDKLVETSGGTKPLSEARDHEYTKMETAAVKDAMRAPPLKKYGAIVEEAQWATVKDEVLREAIRQRWTKDARFRRIVEAARDQGKTLLYYTPGNSTSNVGGVFRAADGRIDGENKIGKMIMELAGFPEV